MFTQSPIRRRRIMTPDSSLDDSFVTQRRGRQSPESSMRLSLDDSFTESPIRDADATRRRRNRRSNSIDLDALNDTIMQSPDEMEIADSSFLDTSQHIDLDTPPRRTRPEPIAYENIFSIGDTSRVSNASEPTLTQEEIDEENRRQLAILQENATFNIEEFDTEDKHVELPVVRMAINPAEISVYDFINISEMRLNAFLEEDAKNIAFKYHNQKMWMGIDRDSLAENVKNPSQIKYECLDERTMIEDKVYYQLRGIGFPSGVISIHDMAAILRDTHRLYELMPTSKVLKSTVSYGYIHYYLPASDLCKAGNDAVVYEVRAIRSVVGGKKKRRTQKKEKKHRKTKRKNRGTIKP